MKTSIKLPKRCYSEKYRRIRDVIILSIIAFTSSMVLLWGVLGFKSKVDIIAPDQKQPVCPHSIQEPKEKPVCPQDKSKDRSEHYV